MTRYAAFLRGVNVGGKNKLPMPDLKRAFERFGFGDARTYLNSGNVVFSSDEPDTCKLKIQIEDLIKGQFQLDVPVFVLTIPDLVDILSHAPDWWGSEEKEIYDNLIFILPPCTFGDVYGEIGEPRQGLEQIEDYKQAVFWSFSRKHYQKTNWWSKTASAKVSGSLTIRTANTVKKIAGL